MLARASLVLLCLAAMVIQSGHAQRRWRKPLDDVYGRYLDRLSAVRVAIGTEPRIGYLGDAPRIPDFPDDWSTGALFAQHALVPIVLAPVEERCRHLLVNWHRPEVPPAIPAGYELVRSFAPGVTLWRLP